MNYRDNWPLLWGGETETEFGEAEKEINPTQDKQWFVLRTNSANLSAPQQYIVLHLEVVSYHEVRLLHHVERVSVDDLSGDPAAVDEGLDGPAGLDTERRDGEAGWVAGGSPDG